MTRNITFQARLSNCRKHQSNPRLAHPERNVQRHSAAIRKSFQMERRRGASVYDAWTHVLEDRLNRTPASTLVLIKQMKARKSLIERVCAFAYFVSGNNYTRQRQKKVFSKKRSNMQKWIKDRESQVKRRERNLWKGSRKKWPATNEPAEKDEAGLWNSSSQFEWAASFCA